MTEPRPRGWTALGDVLRSARHLDHVVNATHFTRTELRDASDQLASDVADWLTSLNADPEDQTVTRGPMLSTDGLAEVRDLLGRRP